MDRDPEVLRQALRGMAELGLLALRRPNDYGGPDVSDIDFRYFQEAVARRSGALSFLQTQHQSAVSLIAKGMNDHLKSEYLLKMADGEKLVGIGFSQLRRPGPPIMTASHAPGGYTLDGQVPWITGWTFFPEYLVAASLPDGRALFAVVPFSEQKGARVSPPMRLAAMESAQTVSMEYSGFFVAHEQVSAIQPVGWIRNNDQINVALQRHFALGCCQAGLDILLQAAERRGLPFVKEVHDELAAELERCRAVAGVDPKDGQATEERLEARAWTIELAVRIAHAAVASCSGAANSLAHPAQRVYREALVYTVSAQTTAVMEATLRRLVR